MILLAFCSTAVSGPQLIKTYEPRSIIYAVILHEVCSKRFLGISKAGSLLLRHLMVEAANVAIRKDEDLKRF